MHLAQQLDCDFSGDKASGLIVLCLVTSPISAGIQSINIYGQPPGEGKAAEEELADRVQTIWWSQEGRRRLNNRQGLRGLLRSHLLGLSAAPAFRTESECRHYCLTAGIHAPIESVFSPCQRKGPAHHSVSLIRALGRPLQLRPQRLRGSHYSQRRNTPNVTMPLNAPDTKWQWGWRGCWQFFSGPLCWTDSQILLKSIWNTKYRHSIGFGLLIHWLQICKLWQNQRPCNKAREKIIIMNGNWKCSGLALRYTSHLQAGVWNGLS